MKKKKDEFPKHLIESWENSDGINFAIALARITGWLLHVDWYKHDGDKEDEKIMIPIRAYVADNSDYIFDFTGRKKLNAFCKYIIEPLLEQRIKNGNGGVATRYYNEELIFKLPLRVKPDKNKIAEAEKAIRLNTTFLSRVPPRPKPLIPAYDAAKFTFGHCSIYAQAMEDLLKIPAVAIVVNKYTDQFAYSKTGYTHSCNMHPDGSIEDVWGHQTVDNILKRFNIAEYQFNEEAHKTVVRKLKQSSPEKYDEIYNNASEIIRKFYDL